MRPLLLAFLCSISLLAAACGKVNESSLDAATTSDSGGPADAEPVASDAAPGSYIPAGGILPFDGACPPGWTELSGVAERYLRGHDGDETFAETGGESEHAHTVAAHAHTLGTAGASHRHNLQLGPSPESLEVSSASGTLDSVGVPLHSHGVGLTPFNGIGYGGHSHDLTGGEASTSPASNTPAFREVILCEAEEPALLVPALAFVITGSSCADGWDEDASFEDRLLRGDDLDGDLGETGGSDDHLHSYAHDHGGNTAAGGAHVHGGSFFTQFADDVVHNVPAGTADAAGGSGCCTEHRHEVTVVSGAHSHAVATTSGDVAAASLLPEYREVVFCKSADGPAPLPPEMLLLVDRECPSGWGEKVEYRQRFLRGHDGDDELGETGGATMHDHAEPAHDHGGATGSSGHQHQVEVALADITVDVASGSDGGEVSPADHTHPVSVSSEDEHAHTIQAASPGVSMAPHTPAFREIVVCARL